MDEVQTLEEMRAACPDEWVRIVDCERDESGSLVRGRLVAHSPRRSDVHKEMLNHPEGGAVRYFGQVPADLSFML